MRLAVVIAAGAATATTAAMSAAAMTAAARAAAMGQRHSINTSRIAWEEHEWASALAIDESANVDNVGFLHFLLKISGFEGCLRLYTPGFCTCLAHNVGRQRHWEVLCVLHKLEMVG